MDIESSDVIVCFKRLYNYSSNDHKDVLFYYIKQEQPSGTYLVKFKTRDNKSTIYTRTQFLVTALSALTLLMAEAGIGSVWAAMNIK